MLTAPVTSSAIGLSSCKCHESTTPVCGFSQDTLVTLLEKARVDGVTRRDTDAYGDYFKSLPCSTNGDVMEHCKECSKTIAKHAPSNTVDKIAADEDDAFPLFACFQFPLFSMAGCDAKNPQAFVLFAIIALIAMLFLPKDILGNAL